MLSLRWMRYACLPALMTLACGRTGFVATGAFTDGGTVDALTAQTCEYGKLIDDMERGRGRICEGAGRRGIWYAFNDGTGAQRPSPQAGTPIAPDFIGPGRGDSSRAMHTWGTGFTNWGAGIGLDLVFDGQTYGSFDGSAFAGITFWAKSDLPDAAIDVRVGTAATTLVAYGGTCEREPCAPAALTIHPAEQWTQFWIPFSYFALQSSRRGQFQNEALTNVQFMAPTTKPFDFWIDDLAFFAGSPDCCLEPPPGCATAIAFADPDVESIVRSAVGKPEGPLACSDVCALDALGLSGGSGRVIDDLDGLQCALHLHMLSLYATDVRDLQPVGKLLELRWLSIDGAPVDDLAPLATLRDLRYVKIANTQASDPSPLANAPRLATAALPSNRIASASALAGLAQLAVVDLQDNLLATVDPFVDLPALQSLNLASNRIYVFAPLLRASGLGPGDSVWLYGNPATCDPTVRAVVSTLVDRAIQVDPDVPPTSKLCP